MTGRLRTLILALAMSLVSCAHLRGGDLTADEAVADLKRRATAVQSRSDGADAQLRELVRQAEAWLEQEGLEISTEKLVQSLLLRPTTLHQAATGEDLDEADRGYGRLEHAAQEVTTARRLVEEDVRALARDVEAVIARYGIEAQPHTEKSRFALGDPFIPGLDGGLEAETSSRCSITMGETIAGRRYLCFLTQEGCQRASKTHWWRFCIYTCLPDRGIIDHL